MNTDQLIKKAKDLGAWAAAVIQTDDISFEADFRKACEMNSCGHFGLNWMCPPAVGSMEELKAQVLEMPRGLLVQNSL